MKYIILSVFGRQKERIAATRIYNLAKYLSLTKKDIYTILSNDFYGSAYDYNFCKRVYDLPLKFIKKSKKTSKKEHTDLTKLQKDINNFILNNISSYKGYRSFKSNNLYFLEYNNKYINKILTEIGVDKNTILITSNGPSKINYFGYRIKKKNPCIFWVADYRDLNQNNPHKSDKFNFKGKKMDKLAFKYADLITTVSQGTKEQNIKNAKNMGLEISDKSYVLYNGFSKNEINNSEKINISLKYKNILSTEKVIIVYTGTIYPSMRIDLFMETLKKVENILFIYAGSSFNLVDHFSKKLGIASKVINLKFIPREEAEFLQKNSDILLLLKAYVKENGILTGKFFEYLQRNKKILSLGDQDEEYNLICRNLKNVDILPYNKERIVKYLKNLRKEDLKENYDPNIERFSWEYLAKEFDDFVSQKLNERKSNI